MNWFFYALLGAISLSAYQVSTRVFLKGKGDSSAFTFVTMLSGGLLSLPFLFFETIRANLSTTDWLMFLVVVLLSVAVDLVFTRARQLEQVSVTSIAIQTGLLWNLLGGLFIFGEGIALQKILGVSLILLGNLVLIWHGQKLRLTPGFCLALLGVFLFNITSSLGKNLVRHFSPVLYIASLSFAEGVIIYGLLGAQRWRRARQELHLQGLKVLLVGPLLAYATILVSKAFEVGGEFSRVLPIFGLALVFSTLSGVFLLGEKENLGRKLLALILAFIGAYLVQSA